MLGMVDCDTWLQLFISPVENLMKIVIGVNNSGSDFRVWGDTTKIDLR
jgi:hypothetical protein